MDFETQRALLIHSAFVSVAPAIERGQVRKLDAYDQIAAQLSQHVLSIPVKEGRKPVIKKLKVTARTIRAHFADWQKDPSIDTIRRRYAKPGSKVPAELVEEIHRLITSKTGGRNKHGLTELTHAWGQLWRAWCADEPIPGLGKDTEGRYCGTPATRRQWYAATYPTQPEPDWNHPELHVPFPFAESTITRIAREAGKELRTLGNVGKAAARKHGYSLRMDYSKLRRCEIFTADDVRLDFIISDPRTGKPVICTAYIMMEVSSRLIASWIVSPRDALNASHVKQLLAAGLRRYGVGKSYTTHILLERGTLAMTDANKILIEATAHQHGVKLEIHRTSMNEGITWTGSYRDQASGNAMGKGMIESFNRSLHKRLLHLDGQIGNHFGNAPASTGYTGAEKSAPGSLARASELLHTFNNGFNAALKKDQRCTLQLSGLLTFPELRNEFKAVIQAHNTERGHAYTGHGETTLVETQPGIYLPE